MASTKKTMVANHKAAAKLPAPDKPRGEELVTLTLQQLGVVQLCADYPNQPAIQAAVAALQADTAKLDTTLTSIATSRAAMVTLETARDAAMIRLLRDRRHLQSTITVVCEGVTDAIKAWGCVVQSKTVVSPSIDAPVGVRAKNSPTASGTVLVRCARAQSGLVYLFYASTDPNAAPGAPTASTTKAACQLVGQPAGQTVYVRAAVIRSSGGQSQWSDAVQLSVR